MRVPTNVFGQSLEEGWSYSHLVVGGPGFAILRTRTTGAATTGESMRIERLVSVDGQTWVVDDGFTNVVEADASIAFHFDDAMGVETVPPEVPIPVEALFERAVVADVEVDPELVCGLEPIPEFERMGLRTVPCPSSDRTDGDVLVPFELVNPGSGGRLLGCVDVLGRMAQRQRTSTAIYRSTTAVLAPLGFLADGYYTQLEDGTVVGLVEADDKLEGFDSCEAFPGAIQKPRPTFVEWFTPEGVSWSLGFPEAISREVGDADLRPSLLAADSSVLAVYGQSIWRVELARGGAAAIELVDLSEERSDLGDVALIDSELAVGVSAASVVLVDLGSDETITHSLVVGDAPEIIYADPDRVIVSVDGPNPALRVIELHSRN